MPRERARRESIVAARLAVVGTLARGSRTRLHGLLVLSIPLGTLPIVVANGFTHQRALWADALFELGVLDAKALCLIEEILAEW